MSCSDRIPPVCQWQFGILAATGCQLPVVKKERKAPLILLFLQKSFAYLMGLGYSAQPRWEQVKNLFPKGVVKGQSARIIRVLGREADLFTRQAAIIGDQRLQNQTH